MNIQNKQLKQTIDFLDSLDMEGQASVGRTNLKELLDKTLEEFTRNQITIIDEFNGWTNREEAHFTESNSEMNQALNKLANTVVDVTFASPFKSALAEAVENYPAKLSGEKADTYALLYEQLILKEDD